MHIKHIHETMENLSRYACEEASKSVESIDTCELEKVVDMVNKLAEAEYYAYISKSMKEAEEEEEAEEKYMLKSLKEEYGEENGRRYYDMWRYKSGRFAPKGRGTRRGYEPVYNMTPEMYEMHSPEYYRDIDKENLGRMFYSGGSSGGSSRVYSQNESGNHQTSRYENARRGYVEAKEMHKGNSTEDKEVKKKELDKWMTEFSNDVKQMVSEMTPEEKTILKTKLQNLHSSI